MSLILTCPGCQKELRLAEPASDQMVRCPQCGISFAAAGARAVSNPDAKSDAGIADRPLPPRVAPAAPRFHPDDDQDGNVARSSSKQPLIVLLVVGGILLVLGCVAVLVVGGAMVFWMRSSPPHPASPAVAQGEMGGPNAMGDEMQPIHHEKWEQAAPGVPFPPNLPMEGQDATGPDEKGRLSFSHSGQVVSVAFLDGGKTLMAAANSGEVRLWDLDPPKRKAVIPPGGRDGITDMAVAPDGKSYVTVNHGGAVQVMDVATKQEKAVLSGKEPAGFSLWAVAYSPNGKTIATAHGNSVVKLWDVATERLRTTFQKHKDQVSSLAFSRDGKLLASGGWDTTVIVWNVAEQKDVATIKAPGAANTGIWALAFAPDGELLAFGGNDQLIHLWDLKKQEERAVCRHLKDVTSAAFSPDGKLLASASNDGTVRLWDGKTGERRAVLPTDYNGPLRGLAFSPDGKKLAVGIGGVQVWDLSKVEMLKGP